MMWSTAKGNDYSDVTHPGSHGFPDATFDYFFVKNVKIEKPIITQTNVSIICL